jgi:hypothetical protein
MKYILSFTFLINLSLRSFAQGKIYIVPTIGFYSGSYRGADSVNNKQQYINTKRFLGKDFIMGIRVNYIKKDLGISVGIESGNFSAGFKHVENDSNPFRTISWESSSQRSIHVFFTETKYEIANFNLKKPKWLKRISDPDKPYMLVSRIAPLIGFEFRRLGNTFVQDAPENSEITTSQESIPGIKWFHSYNRNHFSMRAGLDWVFYDREKRKFIINLIYSFAFEDAGYFYYRFWRDTPREFHFRNNCRGNGISLKGGVPIGIFKKKKL